MQQFRIVDRRDVLPKRPDRYLSFPGLVRLGPGRILMGYRDGRSVPGTYSHGADGDLKLLRYEHGRWGKPELLYAHEGGVEEMGCGDLTRLRDGTVTLFSRQWDGANHRSIATYIARSADGGTTFGPRRAIPLPMFPGGWAPYGKVIEGEGGVWLQGAYGRAAAGEGSSSACIESRDGGETWELRSWIAAFGCIPCPNFHEPMMFRLGDGTFFALLRTNGLFYAARSRDEARTWSLPEPSFEGMACAGIVLSSGELLVTYRGIHHDGPPPGTRVPIQIHKGRLYCCRASADGGRTWTPEMSLDDNEAHQVGSYGMGDALELEDGTVLVVFYTSDKDQAPWIQQVTLAR